MSLDTSLLRSVSVYDIPRNQISPRTKCLVCLETVADDDGKKWIAHQDVNSRNPSKRTELIHHVHKICGLFYENCLYKDVCFDTNSLSLSQRERFGFKLLNNASYIGTGAAFALGAVSTYALCPVIVAVANFVINFINLRLGQAVLVRPIVAGVVSPLAVPIVVVVATPIVVGTVYLLIGWGDKGPIARVMTDLTKSLGHYMIK